MQCRCISFRTGRRADCAGCLFAVLSCPPFSCAQLFHSPGPIAILHAVVRHSPLLSARTGTLPGRFHNVCATALPTGSGTASQAIHRRNAAADTVRVVGMTLFHLMLGPWLAALTTDNITNGPLLVLLSIGLLTIAVKIPIAASCMWQCAVARLRSNGVGARGRRHLVTPMKIGGRLRPLLRDARVARPHMRLLCFNKLDLILRRPPTGRGNARR